MPKKVDYVKKECEVVNEIAKILRKAYGPGWNFEIDFIEGDPAKNFVLRIKVYNR